MFWAETLMSQSWLIFAHLPFMLNKMCPNIPLSVLTLCSNTGEPAEETWVKGEAITSILHNSDLKVARSGKNTNCNFRKLSQKHRQTRKGRLTLLDRK